MKALRVPLALAALAGTLAQAQNTVTANPSPAAETADSVRRTPAQLEQLLGPIALYPDALVAIMLPASTVPADIVMAARYLRDNPGLEPSQLEHRTWDESVKSLVRYPDVLRWMDENLDWTKQVGEAFVVQPAEVMQAMQRLRAKARAAGTLVDTPQQQVIADTNVIRIVPAQADLIYVPQYEPEVVYVNQPVYSAWPYVTFGVGFAVGSWLAYDCDWRYNRIWVGNPYRPWYGHNWCYPLIRPPFPYYSGAPIYGYGGYGYGPYPRPWCPPAYAHRPPGYRPGMSYPGVPRPTPFGSVAGNSSPGAATLQPGSGPGGTAARSATPGMRRDPATGFWTSVPSASTNLGGRPAGMAATNAARSAARGLYTSPSASGTRSSSLPNTVPQFSSSRGGSLPSTVPQFQGSGGGSLPNTVPQFRGSGIGSLPATVPRFRGSRTDSLPSTVPSFRDPGVTSLPNTTPSFPGASLQTGTGRSASDRARSHGAYANYRSGNVTPKAPSASAGYAAATPSPAPSAARGTTAPSSPRGNTWQRQGRESTVVQNYPGQRSAPPVAPPSAPVTADATSASPSPRAFAGRASPPAYAPRPSSPVAAAPSTSASPRAFAGRASPPAYAAPSYTPPAYAPPSAAAAAPSRAQPSAGRSGPPPAASRGSAATASQSSGGESTAATTGSAPAPAPSTGSSAGWGSRGMGRSGGGRF